MLSNKATKKLYFEKLKKTSKLGCAVRTHFRVHHPIFCSKKDQLCLFRGCVKFQQPNPFQKFNLRHLKKIIFNHSEGGWEGLNKSVPYIDLNDCVFGQEAQFFVCVSDSNTPPTNNLHDMIYERPQI